MGGSREIRRLRARAARHGYKITSVSSFPETMKVFYSIAGNGRVKNKMTLQEARRILSEWIEEDRRKK